MRLTGHAILITGGTSGIGRALARELHRRDNHIVITGRDRPRLEAAVASMPGSHGLTADLTNGVSRETLIAQAAEHLRGLSILVNNAGIQYRHDYLHDDPARILAETEEEIQLNLTALVALTVMALPHLRAAPEAAIVNISSVLAYTPKRTAPVYCATKAAVRSFTRALRYQLANEAPHVRAMDVLPPMVDTPMTAGRGKPGAKMSAEDVARRICGALERDQTDVPLGLARTARLLMRVAPSLLERRFRNQ